MSNNATLDLGIETAHAEKVAQGLSSVLADSFLLYTKARDYHWNVTGPSFLSLHNFFEEQYNDLALAIDEIAERIRTLGFRAPGRVGELMELSSVKEDPTISTDMEMVADLLSAHETVMSTIRSMWDAAEAAGDESTLDMLTARLQTHSKTSWMLKSILGN